MAKRRMRVLGGPFHGEVKEVDFETAGRRVVFPSEPYYRLSVSYDPDYFRLNGIDCSPRLNTIEYEVRRIGLGNDTRISVLCPPNMTEAEQYRRLADIIEGVGGRGA